MSAASAWQRVLLCLTLAFPLLSFFSDVGTGGGVRLQQFAYGLSALAWLGSIYLASRTTAPPLVWVIVLCLLARLAFLPAEISDDVYRYVWEGLIRLHGFSPYAIAPDDPALVPLRTEWWSLINHPNHAGIYPPTAQAIFTVWASVFPDPRAYKYALLVVELLALPLLAFWLQRRQQPMSWLFVYALCPATLNAIAREGHLDALLILGLVGLGWATSRATRCARDALWAGVFLGFAIGCKWIALLLGPWVLLWLLRGPGRPAAVGTFLLGMLLSFGLPASFYLQDGVGIWFGPLRYFAENFHSLDFLRQSLLPWLGTDGMRWLSGIVLLLVAGATSRRDLSIAQVWLFGSLLILSPTLHPWYVTWLLPGLCFARRTGWLMLPLSLVVAFEGDWYRATTGTWQQPAWVAAAVHLPLYLALLVTSVRRPEKAAS